MTETAEKKPAEEFMERAGEIAMTWIDITPIARALEAEYRRGLADGGKDGADAYERGRADMRAEILKSLGVRSPVETHLAPIEIHVDRVNLPKLPSIGITARPVVIHSDQVDVPEKPVEVLSDGTGVHSHARPAGIPSTFQMFQIVLREMPGKLTAKELVAELARRWWPGLKFERLSPDISTSVTKGRIHRDQDGRLRLTEKGDKIDATDNRGMAKGAQPPQPKQAEIPKPRVNGHGTGRLFVREGCEPISLLPAEWTLAETLQKAMGKGFVDVGFLATKIWGHARGQDTQGKIDQLIATLNPKLIEIGLRTEYHRGFGYVMKEIT